MEIKKKKKNKSYNPEEDRRSVPEIQMPAPKGRLPCKPKPIWICNNTYYQTRHICFFN